MSACEETLGPRGPDPEKTVCESEDQRQGLHDVALKPGETRAGAQPGAKGVATYREFADALIEVGLIDAASLERYAADSAEGVLGLSRALVKAGYLTPYQAAAVYQNKSRGLLIGNYLILDKIGQGGMGVVFKARHRKLGRLGALKILPPSFTRDRGAVTRFRREFEAAARLKHVNLVAAFEADEDRGVHFLVMDYVVGINLDRFVGEQGPLPVPQAVDYLIQSARGLEAAHEKGIIHRDIKPGNLMLDRAGTVRVLDLGLARIVDASNPFSKTVSGRLTQSGTYMGSIDYMAPEQAEDAHSADHRADIYSLGCTFFFLLTGQAPFSGPSTLKRMVAHQEHPAPSLLAIRPEVSPALEAAYQRMMAKRPEDRPASMTEVIMLLHASKHLPETGMATAAPLLEPRPAQAVCRETPLKPADLPRTIVDSAIFGRRAEVEGTLIDNDLNLRDLVIDVRSDVRVPEDPSAVDEERAGASDDRELSLRELAMALREEAAPPALPKPPAADRQPLKRSALPRQEDPPPAAPKPPAADARPMKPAGEPRPLKRSALPRQEDAPPAAPKPPVEEIQPMRPAALTRSGELTSNKGLAILAVVTAILLVVAVVLFISRQRASAIKNQTSPPAVDSDDRENPPDLAPTPPV